MMFAQLRQARRMGSAAAIAISSGRICSALLLQRSRGRLLSFSSPIFADAPSSSVAPRQILAHVSFSTVGRRSCSTIKEGSSHPKRGELQDPAMGLATSEQWAPTTEMRSVEEMEQAALEKVMGKIFTSAMALNIVEVKTEAESAADKLGEMQVRLGKLEDRHKSPNKALKKVVKGMAELRKKCDRLDAKVALFEYHSRKIYSDLDEFSEEESEDIAAESGAE